MTVVVSDGYYLLADHRTTADRTPSITGFALMDGYRNNRLADGTEKIKLFCLEESPILQSEVNGETRRVRALAYTGALSFAEAIIKNLNEMNGKIVNIDEKLKEYAPFSSIGRVVGVDDKFHTHVWIFQSKECKKSVHNPGVRVRAGCTRDDMITISRFCEMQPPLEVEIFLSSRRDPGCSSSYGVFGNKENQYYRAVVPTRAYADEQILKYKQAAARKVLGLDKD